MWERECEKGKQGRMKERGLTVSGVERQAQTARPIKASLKRKRKLQVKWKSAAGNEAYKWPARMFSWAATETEAESGKEVKRPLCDRKLTSKAELKDFPPHQPTKFWWIIKYGQCKEEAAAEEYAETPSWGGGAKKVALMKPPSMAGGKFAQRCSCSSRERKEGGRGLQQLVGCLNERSNEHRNECAPHDKYVKFLLKLSSICCQFLTTSATNFVLVRVSTRTQRVFPTSAATAAAAASSTSSWSFFGLRLAAAVFPWHLQHSQISQHSTSSQLSTLSSPFGSRHCSRPSQALAHFKLLTQKLILASGCCQPSQHSQPAGNSQQPTVVAACSFLLFLSFYVPLPLSVSLSRCAFSGFSFFCWLQYFIAFAVRVLHTFERRWGLP